MGRFMRRRKIIVDKGLQLRLVSLSLGYVVFYVAALTAALFVPLILQLDRVDLSSREAREIAISVLYLHKHFWPVAALVLAVVALHSLLTTHKLAGPLYRFRRIIESVREGTLPGPARLRRRDFFQSEMKLINGMLESLRFRVSEIQKAQASLAESVSDCKRRAEFLADAEMTRCVSNLAAKGDQLAESVLSFRMPDEASPAGTARGEMSHRDEGAECSKGPPVRHSRGFTVVEVVIGVAIIVTVAAIAVPSYLQMVNTARVTRAAGDVTEMSTEIDLYRLRTGAFPASLTDVGLDGRHDPWGNPYYYLRIAGQKGLGDVRKDRNLVPLNTDYDLYSAGTDGKSEPPITASMSHDDIIRANNGSFVGLARNY